MAMKERHSKGLKVKPPRDDVKRYSSLMSQDEEATISLLCYSKKLRTIDKDGEYVQVV
jgi:hypothetical protein